ncbi:MOSC domain-containing protein [Marinomonas sp. 15G1-11]|uniref:MOSC domain-containing protein n=1 Tax=Marinomonas phaeophyticola TaxID=3004091 RepID=A0ABT4K0H0_9GAMM|nr:MOSC N-terminal beta barrel domain-containing protein [Marinomonas sp. 15G1-11]MCZ2723513.1 MOSC domain-containing protein [Marinomonas sp. 15G1-11]
MPATVSELAIYPIKSIQGIKLTQAVATDSGFFNDRRYMLVKRSGEFITGRENPSLTLVRCIIHPDDTLELSHPNTDIKLVIDPNSFSDRRITVTIWENEVEARICGSQFDQWFSSVLGEEVLLTFFDQDSKRVTKRRPEMPVAFADGYPYLITSKASLNALNDRCSEAMSMERFRSNIVVDHCDAFEEDTWQTIKIGEAIFEATKPCSRCIFTTLDPITAQRSRKGEPIKTLAKFRMTAEKEVTFGMNFVCIQEGIVKENDTIEVISYRVAEQYQDKTATKS